MKKSILNFTAIAMMLIATSCTEDDGDNGKVNNLSSAQLAELKSITEEGSWVISYFFDTDKEETSHFNGYTFTFNSNGTLSATNGTNEVNGTWSITDSDSNDDSDDDSDDDSSDVDFNISFTAPADFEDLSDDWDIVKYSTIRIELIDVSGGNGGTDNLVFEKP
ncbi:hypothetical protein [Allomuricauda sp. CP2A]|jgi:hypothetical protein|uniref:hypothetical protein n=1 Tax=Allomuricauda sp. CP2A TaxID=1848189 RepID=UPI0008299DFB|nr:hypothetical protein [Muricauda sp. CP2A]